MKKLEKLIISLSSSFKSNLLLIFDLLNEEEVTRGITADL